MAKGKTGLIETEPGALTTENSPNKADLFPFVRDGMNDLGIVTH